MEHLDTKRNIVRLGGFSEPCHHESPATLDQEQLEKINSGGAEDVDVDDSGHELSGELLHERHQPVNLDTQY